MGNNTIPMNPIKPKGTDKKVLLEQIAELEESIIIDNKMIELREAKIIANEGLFNATANDKRLSPVFEYETESKYLKAKRKLMEIEKDLQNANLQFEIIGIKKRVKNYEEALKSIKKQMKKY